MSDVAKTGASLRDAETELARVVCEPVPMSAGEALKAIRAYGDALLAHHNAVEAAKKAAREPDRRMADA